MRLRHPCGSARSLWVGTQVCGRSGLRTAKAGCCARLCVSPPRCLSGESAEVWSRTTIRHRRQIGAGNDNSPAETEFEIQEAHLRWRPEWNRNIHIRLGRQRFRDPREWYYDAFLDAAQLRFQTKLARLEFALAKGLSGGTSRRDQFHGIANARFRLPGRRYASTRLLKRVDDGRREELTWLGFGSQGRVAGRLRYWSELALLNGTDRAVPVRAWGTDSGLSYRFRRPLRPTVSALYAAGSGDHDPSDGVDGNFRQTRLNGNSDSYDGLRRRPYYGRILAPELSNIQVMSVDFGLRSGNRWSLNLSALDYRQVRMSTRLAETGPDLSPSGRDRRLGREFNVSFVWRRAPRLDLIFDAGVLKTGPAFPQSSRWLCGLRQELRFYF